MDDTEGLEVAVAAAIAGGKVAIDLLTNESKREMFGKAGRARAIECFECKRIVKMYEDYYAECLEGGAAGTRAARS